MSYIPLPPSCREEDEDLNLDQISKTFDPGQESLLSAAHFAQTGSSVPGQWLLVYHWVSQRLYMHSWSVYSRSSVYVHSCMFLLNSWQIESHLCFTSQIHSLSVYSCSSVYVHSCMFLLNSWQIESHLCCV